MKKLNLQATHNLYIYIYRFLASVLLVFGLVFTGYAATVFDEPKVSFSGDTGMSSSDKQYIDNKLKDLENLITSRMSAMENRVNTTLQNSRSPYIYGLNVKNKWNGWEWEYSWDCPAGYVKKTEVYPYQRRTNIALCVTGPTYKWSPDNSSEGGNHD